MSVLNFATVFKVLIDHTPTVNQDDLFANLFDSYYEEAGKIDTPREYSISKILSGEKHLERKGKQYYSDPENRKSFITDIKEGLLNHISEKYEVCNKLKELIIADGMDDRDRNSLLKTFPERDEDISEFIADVIIFTLNRPVKKGAASPLISERINTPAVASCKYFCGREKELQTLSEMLETRDKIFIKGIGGIGKSELVKKYIKVNKIKYTNILFLTYSESLMNTVAGIPFKGDSKDDKIGDLYAAHIDFLRYMRGDTLIIIDNFDVLPDTDCGFDEIMELQCKVIFTTRCDVSSEYDVLNLGDMDKSALFEMAEQLKLNIEDKETLDRIFCAVHYHTLACELIIRLLNKSAVSPDVLLEKLLTMHVNIDVKDKIRKEGSLRYSEHIHNLFRLFALTDEQKNIMLLLLLIPVSGISDSYYLYLTGSEDMNIINELCEIGLVIYDEHLIQVHPLIGEAAAADFTPDMDNCRLFIDRLNRELTNHTDNLENYMRQAVILEIADRVVEFCDKNDTDFYFSSL